MVKMYSLHDRSSFCSVRPRVRVHTTAAVQPVVKVVADTSCPSNRLLSVGRNILFVYRSSVVAEADRTVETLAGVVAAALLLGCGWSPSAVSLASPMAAGGSSAGGATKVGGYHMITASTDVAPIAAGTTLVDAADVEGAKYGSRAALAHVAAPFADQGGGAGAVRRSAFESVMGGSKLAGNTGSTVASVDTAAAAAAAALVAVVET